jgi:hypothetical protein
MCSGRVSSTCSTNGARRVNLVTNPVTKMRKGSGSGTHPLSLVTQIFHNGKTYEVRTLT